MERVGIREFRAKLSEYLKKDVEIMERGKVIGRYSVYTDSPKVSEKESESVHKVSYEDKLAVAREALRVAEERASNLGVEDESVKFGEFSGKRIHWEDGEEHEMTFEDVLRNVGNRKVAIVTWRKMEAV